MEELKRLRAARAEGRGADVPTLEGQIALATREVDRLTYALVRQQAIEWRAKPVVFSLVLRGRTYASRLLSRRIMDQLAIESVASRRLDYRSCLLLRMPRAFIWRAFVASAAEHTDLLAQVHRQLQALPQPVNES